RSVRGLRGTGLGAHDNGLGRDDRTAAARGPCRAPPLGVAPGALRVRGIHHHPVVADVRGTGPPMRSRLEPRPVAPDPEAVPSPEPGAVTSSYPDPMAFPARRSRLVPVFITLATAAVAMVLGRSMWRAYMDTPWTRDGTVRAYIVA